ncbi:conserved hypothetical protein [Pectobacterium atrosepticum SCRI1043]|uniref:DUF2857 domain-containing protein n=2 Tax=Pectobacterium atrosepticum TaxID=29471 RepID=Q6D9U1_PECAS|nr:DUF2857 domain-containing protein [Pectobacterium atrosepticum]GKV85819.1 hypothetical protein PEC301296_21310 [Pectobacterium carotovorum subsp. carotovorum]AFH56817.1 hypothetical protein KCQ_12840 [Pectobacterium atrosepticum]AIK12775.1 hypothetical protein GZ59_09090 [Pectobacterium atrosepticum]ATY89359.1 DUF2857 domain-containing protein [Pectobacterium atrosepticum]KFX11936.1 hypothetical protein JV34_19455 [Pectobacterium atrosepticum]
MSENSLQIANASQSANNLLTQLVMDLKSGYIRRCESLGLKQEEMQLLQSLTIEDLHYISNSSVSVLQFNIHHENFYRLVQHARREQMRTQRIDRALSLGGSIELMQHMFGLSSLEVANRRRIAGIDVRPGRGVVLSEEESTTLWQRWQLATVENVDSGEGLDVMMLAAEQMDVSLTAVWHAVRSWSQTHRMNISAESAKKTISR